mmetsp:Transcript_70243/g.195514  ORF Transcript_70243/g.195514 Transcript_70243/m.195514 type:complete len:206 (+) Transcript_70243:634-1251(+)
MMGYSSSLISFTPSSANLRERCSFASTPPSSRVTWFSFSRLRDWSSNMFSNRTLCNVSRQAMKNLIFVFFASPPNQRSPTLCWMAVVLSINHACRLWRNSYLDSRSSSVLNRSRERWVALTCCSGKRSEHAPKTTLSACDERRSSASYFCGVLATSFCEDILSDCPCVGCTGDCCFWGRDALRAIASLRLRLEAEGWRDRQLAQR